MLTEYINQKNERIETLEEQLLKLLGVYLDSVRDSREELSRLREMVKGQRNMLSESSQDIANMSGALVRAGKLLFVKVGSCPHESDGYEAKGGCDQVCGDENHMDAWKCWLRYLYKEEVNGAE